MELWPVERGAGAFQEPVSGGQIDALCRRAFGISPVSVVEIAGGSYNNAFRVDIGDVRPVILRVAPAPDKQARIEWRFMRNEHAALPFFAPVAAMMPRTLFVDWTHELIGRDYVWQTLLDGVSGADGLSTYPRSDWGAFYRQIGSIARRIHDVRGEWFGGMVGPRFGSWSDAVLSALVDTVADLVDAGLDADDVRDVVALVERDRAVLDEVREPRLLHGDLWVPNVMLATGAAAPTITGVFDHDRASWGDPAADWTIHVVRRRAERDAFWETYGRLDDRPGSVWRALVYEARHLGAVRLERHRLGKADRIPETYQQMRAVLDLMRPSRSTS